jgi:hypothetical protein
MSEDTPPPVVEPTPLPETESTPPPPSSPTSAPKGFSLPMWLPLFLLAVIPALIVGIAVALVAGGGSSSSDDGQAAAIIDGFIHSSPSSDQDITSYKKQLPPGFPKDFPAYPGAKIVGSFGITGSDSTNYFAVLSSSDDPSKVYDFYLQRLDKDPWQVQISATSDQFTGVRFTQPAEPDIAGEVALHRSTLDKRTNIYVTFQDSSTPDVKKPDPNFNPGQSRALPSSFPGDVPIYKGKTPTTVTETYMERSPGSIDYVITALTKDSQDDVVSFYKQEFDKKGWTVTDSTDKSKGLAIGMDFADSAKKFTGSVAADTYDKDDKFTKVDLYVTANTGAGKPTSPTSPASPASPTPKAP